MSDSRDHERTDGADVTIACPAPYGQGGLGRQGVDLARFFHGPQAAVRVLATGPPPTEPAHARVEVHATPRAIRLSRMPPFRWSPSVRQELICAAFDRRIASVLRADGTGSERVTFVAFTGSGLRSMRAAESAGYQQVGLMASNSHVDQVRRQHRLALERHPLERSWLGRRERDRTVKEYELADLLLVASDYTAQSLVERGFDPARVVKILVGPDPRFVPPDQPSSGDGFEIVYTGSLTVPKGIPLLVEAITALGRDDVRLTLVGGPNTRGMRRFLDQARAENPRIVLAPGDPLPHLQRADLYVHPSYEDGLAYAPLEALAVGLPVVVTEDTGMKEHLPSDGPHAVVPTGDLDALVAAIESAYQRVSTETPRLIYVAATGRAGSTLLELLLATAPGVVTLGELQVLPHEFGDDPHRMGCGCGRPVAECPFWTVVTDHIEHDTMDELTRFREQHHAGRTIRPKTISRSLLRPRLDVATERAIDQYGEATGRLLRAVSEVSAADGTPITTVVDASKDPYRLLWLARSGLFDLSVVHLTRHPAAFARSVLRRSHPDAGAAESFVISARKAVAWDATTAVCLGARRFVPLGRWSELSYEELATDPATELARLARRLDVDVPPDAAERYRTVQTHAVAGNPMRGERRPVELDDAWRGELPAATRATVSAVTWPVRRRVARTRGRYR